MAYKTQPFLLLRTSSYVTQITQIGLCGNGAQTSTQAGIMHVPQKRKLYYYDSDTDRQTDGVKQFTARRVGGATFYKLVCEPALCVEVVSGPITAKGYP